MKSLHVKLAASFDSGFIWGSLSVVITGVDLCERSKSAQLNIIICLAQPERWGVTPSPSLLVESPLNTASETTKKSFWGFCIPCIAKTFFSNFIWVPIKIFQVEATLALGFLQIKWNYWWTGKLQLCLTLGAIHKWRCNNEQPMVTLKADKSWWGGTKGHQKR